VAQALSGAGQRAGAGAPPAAGQAAPLPYTQLTLFLPLRLSEDAYGARQAWHARLLFRSLERRWHGPFPRLVVSAPSALLDRTRAWLDGPDGAAGRPYALVADEALVPSAHFAALPGWFRQMLVKLAFARACETRFYLTLDADVVLLRRGGAWQLMKDGRANTKWERVGAHPEWWRASARLLGLAAPPRPEERGLSVTPNMLSTRIARRTLELLEAAQGGARFDDVLARTGGHATTPWTEYSLYTLGGRLSGWLEEDHLSPEEVAAAAMHPVFGDGCLWGPSSRPILEDLVAGRRLRERLGTGVFLVFQSTLDLDLATEGEAAAASLLGERG
jgi:hypothetical protein